MIKRTSRLSATALVGMVALLPATPAVAQDSAEKRGSDNIEVVAHIPLGPRVSDIEIEQDMDRPYAYVARQDGGLDIIDLHDPYEAKVIHRWRIEDQDLHIGSAGKDIKIFSWEGRHYVVHSVQFRQGGPDADLGAIVFDATGLPDVSIWKEVGRIQGPGEFGGFHNIYVYNHSNGRPLLISTVAGPFANVYDLGYVVDGRLDDALVAQIPVPQPENVPPGRSGYHDFYAGYHADSETDRFYGGGTGGYYVYNITDLENPELLVSLTGINGVGRGHTFTPSPDGRYVVAEVEYQYAPLRIFDLKPGLDGEVANINRPISAWTANWEHLSHNHEVRWPFVFVSAYLDGMQVFSLSDPKHPKTIAHYDTYLEPDENRGMGGNWGVDVRNADGLIVSSDAQTGFWAFYMEGFNGWNGLDWGQPNISSAQDWENGPAVQAVTRD